MSVENPRASESGSHSARMWEISGRNWERYISLIARSGVRTIILGSDLLRDSDTLTGGGSIMDSMLYSVELVSSAYRLCKKHNIDRSVVDRSVAEGIADARIFYSQLARGTYVDPIPGSPEGILGFSPQIPTEFLPPASKVSVPVWTTGITPLPQAGVITRDPSSGDLGISDGSVRITRDSSGDIGISSNSFGISRDPSSGDLWMKRF